MPTSTMKKVVDKCNYSMDEVEDKGEEAKKQAEKQDQGDDFGYITSIFKNMLSNECLNKLGGNKNESKEDLSMSKTQEILERIDQFLIHEQEDEIDGDAVGEGLMDAAKDIFDDVDEDKVKGVYNSISDENPKDTEDAIQIGINMLRAD